MFRNAIFLSYTFTGTVFLDAFEQKTDFGTKGRVKLENGTVNDRATLHRNETGWLSCSPIGLEKWSQSRPYLIPTIFQWIKPKTKFTGSPCKAECRQSSHKKIKECFNIKMFVFSNSTGHHQCSYCNCRSIRCGNLFSWNSRVLVSGTTRQVFSPPDKLLCSVMCVLRMAVFISQF